MATRSHNGKGTIVERRFIRSGPSWLDGGRE